MKDAQLNTVAARGDNTFNTRKFVLMGLLTAILILFSFTPIGTLPIGPLSITLNIIPIAIAAISMGPAGGAAMGAVFGLLSFLQCFGIGILSPMGATLVSINPFLAFIQRFIPRLLDGFLVGLIYEFCKKRIGSSLSCFVTGFFSAFLNTAFFMTALVALFGQTDYVQNLMGGKNVLLFICTFVGINAVVEMIASTIISGAIGTALHKAKLLPF